MDPTKVEPAQPTVSDVAASPNQGSAVASKEAAPINVDTAPASAPERPVGEFVTSSNSELQPSPDLAGVVKPTYVAQPPQQVINAAAAQIPPDPLQVARANLPTATAIAKKGDIKSSNTWIAAMREFFYKRIIARLTGRKLQTSNI